MPLEAQLWVDDPDQHDMITAVAIGHGTMLGPTANGGDGGR